MLSGPAANARGTLRFAVRPTLREQREQVDGDLQQGYRRARGQQVDGPVLKQAPLVTPDGRYIVVKHRLWRRANPALPEAERQRLVDELMAARRAVGVALGSADTDDLARARGRVDAAKCALGERGPVWWDDGSPDQNRRMVRNTPYAEWYERNAPRSGERPA